MYIYDTNVVSEIRKKTPDKNLVNFIKKMQQKNHPIFISNITLGLETAS